MFKCMPIVGVNRPSLENTSLQNDRARVFQGINDNIDYIDQAFAQATFTAQHGVETLIANPYGASSSRFPVAILSHYATDSTTGLVTPIANISISAPRADKRIGITVQYDLAHTQPSLIRTASAVQSIAAAGGDKQLTGWDTTESSRGSVISDNGALFTVSEAGSYLVALLVRFQSGATYTKCEATIRAGGVNHGDSFVPAPMTDGGYFTCSAVLRLAAGGTFDASCFQDNAAAAARNVLSGASTGRRIAIHRLYNDTLPTAAVKAVFISGS